MFIAALCTIAKKRRQAKCLQMVECTHTHTHTHTHRVKQYSVLKKKEIQSVAIMWMDLEGIK